MALFQRLTHCHVHEGSSFQKTMTPGIVCKARHPCPFPRRGEKAGQAMMHSSYKYNFINWVYTAASYSVINHFTQAHRHSGTISKATCPLWMAAEIPTVPHSPLQVPLALSYTGQPSQRWKSKQQMCVCIFTTCHSQELPRDPIKKNRQQRCPDVSEHAWLSPGNRGESRDSSLAHPLFRQWLN